MTDQPFNRSESTPLNKVCAAARPRTAISPGTVSVPSRGGCHYPHLCTDRAGCVSPTEDDSSDLTHGESLVAATDHSSSLSLSQSGLSQVMCGNPVRALKARRRRGLYSQVIRV